MGVDYYLYNETKRYGAVPSLAVSLRYGSLLHPETALVFLKHMFENREDSFRIRNDFNDFDIIFSSNLLDLETGEMYTSEEVDDWDKDSRYERAYRESSQRLDERIRKETEQKIV